MTYRMQVALSASNWQIHGARGSESRVLKQDSFFCDFHFFVFHIFISAKLAFGVGPTVLANLLFDIGTHRALG